MMLPDIVRSWAFRLMSQTPRLHPGARRYRACIVKHDRIGDFVLATGAIRSLVQHYGEKEVLLVISPFGEEIARAEFPGTDRLVVPAFGFSLLKEIVPAAWKHRSRFSGLSCETLICLRYSRSFYENMVLGWIHADHSFGANSPGVYAKPEEPEVAPFSFDCEPPYAKEPDAQTCREVRTHGEILAQATGTGGSSPLPVLSIPTEEREEVVLCPFSSVELKSLNFPAFLEGLISIRSSLGGEWRCILPYAPTDQNRVDDLMVPLKGMGLSDWISPVTTKSLEEYFSRIAKGGLIISADSAAAHVATALDKRALLFLGGGHYGDYAPWQRSSRQKWLTHHTDCFGCGWKCVHPEPYCLSSIRTDDILSAFENVLNNDS